MAVADPFQGFQFRVTIEGFGGEVGFSTVSGLNEETDIVDYREGDDPPRMRKLRGMTSFGNVTLSRGIDPNSIFREWRDLVLNSQQDHLIGAPIEDIRRDVTIRLRDAEGDDVYEWILVDAWPAVRNVDDLDAAASDVLVESIELTHHGIKEALLKGRQGATQGG